jgi:hypothetical protein
VEWHDTPHFLGKRVEIPYAFVIRVVEVRDAAAQPRTVPKPAKKK